jgi:mannan endo-1,4-beta-mannosidase
VTQTTLEPDGQQGNHRRTIWVRTFIGLVACAAVVFVTAVVVDVAKRSDPPQSVHAVPTVRYLGVYEPGAPGSYTGIDQFAQAIGRQPNIVLYYPTWREQFQVGFATAAAKRGALTLVQLDTDSNISLASIASGQYDHYWQSYADEVRAFRGQVILSFDHEMNGDWYPWGYRHTSPAVFVAAWRHVVDIFREQGARNVIWMWTVNILSVQDHIPGPARWWPGSPYVNWVGIDGYYYASSETFASLFGPTIADVRELTDDPILIAETGIALSAGQPAKIADLFAGVHTFGLLGFVLFDRDGAFTDVQSWRINSRAAYAALRQGAKEYMKPPL